MVPERLKSLSDREAVEHYCFDNRWRYAAGVSGYDTNGWVSFSHTVLVDMHERLRNSARPDRIFAAALGAAGDAVAPSAPTPRRTTQSDRRRDSSGTSDADLRRGD